MFYSDLDVRALISAPDEFVLLRTLRWRGGFKDVDVPRGFITDFASVPRLLREIPALDPNGPSRRAAVLHDFLYCTRPCLRKQADALFRLALKSEGIGSVTRFFFWAGVRLGGWIYWNRRAKHQELDAQDFVPDTYWETEAPVTL